MAGEFAVNLYLHFSFLSFPEIKFPNLLIRLLNYLREVIKKKNGKKAVRLTAWVDPPLPSPEAVKKM